MEFTAEKTAGSGGTFARELNRLVDGKIVKQFPQFDEEYGVPDPKRYVMEFCGYSDVFQEPRYAATDPDDLVDRVIVEFRIVSSKKWLDTRISMAMNIPKDWTFERGKLHQLFSALQGRPIVDGDAISFPKSLGKQFEGEVVNNVSQRSKRDYAEVVTFLALQPTDDDDRIPVGAAAGDDFPTS